jgi:hypothetical protein
MVMLYFYMPAALTLTSSLGIVSEFVKWFFKFHASGKTVACITYCGDLFDHVLS